MIELTTVPCRGEDGEVTTWAQRLALNLKARFSNLTELVDSDSFYEHLAVSSNVSPREACARLTNYKCACPTTENAQRQIET